MQMPLKQRSSAVNAFETLDGIDRLIIAELQASPRLRIAELGRRIGLSAPAAADRLRRLEDTGVLTYRADVDPRALGYTLFAIVRISPVNGGLRLIPGIAREVPNVTECYRITGEDCYFMKVYLRSIEDLEPILDLFTPHGRTTTSIVHSAPVPSRPLPVQVLPGIGSYQGTGPSSSWKPPDGGLASVASFTAIRAPSAAVRVMTRLVLVMKSVAHAPGAIAFTAMPSGASAFAY
jgi:Lrp/AsnC family leucine-responsive transcriptional regulator